MKEAFSQSHKIVLKKDSEKEKREPQKKKTPVKKETLQKMVDLELDIKNVFYEEDAQNAIAEKEKSKKSDNFKRDKKEQIQYEALMLASMLEVPVSDSVGINAILDAIKEKIEEKKKEAGHDLKLMSDVLAYEVSYKSLCTDNEVFNNTNNRLGVASLADYNRFRLGL